MESSISNETNIVDVQIEISKHSNVKYEIDHKTHMFKCDRILHGPINYNFNYGFIVNTLSEDGDPLDAVVLCDAALWPTCVIQCKIIGALTTEDEKGKDDKIILVPINSVDPESIDVDDLCDIPKHVLKKVEYFFTHYKDLEPGKFIHVDKFVSRKDANEIYKASCTRYTDDMKINL
jgi:inorganic pyrophosphatase